ncbi:Kelch repeat-containing protein [Corallococcus sicarius]|nr:kelch repeat-containing protein [Corallococcus sicarius]
MTSLKSSLSCLLTGLLLCSAGCESPGSFNASLHIGSKASEIVSGVELTGAMVTGRRHHTATLLNNGKVLVAGGNQTVSLTSIPVQLSELYDPVTGSWTSSGSMVEVRNYHTATKLNDGRVLVVGGYEGATMTAELYNPATGVWSATGSPPGPKRFSHEAVLLSNGKVLVSGGSITDAGYSALATIYDPGTGTWSATSSMQSPRIHHSLTLLKNGRVLAVGGMGPTPVYPFIYSLSTAEIYDPATGTWSLTGSMAHDPIFLTPGRRSHAAAILPSGKVLVAGGYSSDGFFGFGPIVANAEVYDPETGTWSPTGSMSAGRYEHDLAILPSGKVLVAGGKMSISDGYVPTPEKVELYDPVTGLWSTVGTLTNARFDSTATVLASGRVLIAGGYRYDSATSKYVYISQAERVVLPFWKPAGNMVTARFGLTATLLPGGRVLTAGGFNGTSPVSSADLRDPTTGAWSAAGSMTATRQFHAATLLSNGKVLVTGGYGDEAYRSSTELFNPTTATWAATGSLTHPRLQHVAVRLANGKVLIAGGDTGLGYTASSELYDPSLGSWTPTGSMTVARTHTTAALLPNGKVLVVGGYDGNATLGTAELYDPATGTWSSAGTPGQAREGASATVLANGKVLVAGGTAENPLNTAEFYDPATNTWTPAPSLNSWRADHTAVRMANGDVMVAGGFGIDTGYGLDAFLDSVEVYEPAQGRWTRTTPLGTLRYAAEGVLLPDGQVLVMGGSDFDGPVATTELYLP